MEAPVRMKKVDIAELERAVLTAETSLPHSRGPQASGVY